MENANPKPNSKQALDQLQREVENILVTLGYEVVALDQSSAGGRIITLFIDFLNNEDGSRRVGLDDCVTVNKAIDELFETTDLLEGHYTLEVSSPGVERPLRKIEDYSRFSGRKAKLHTYRPLEVAELGNPKYWEKNKKQKNFIGILEGLDPVSKELARQNGTAVDRAVKIKLNVDGQSVTIPLELISKAHLAVDWSKQ